MTLGEVYGWEEETGENPKHIVGEKYERRGRDILISSRRNKKMWVPSNPNSYFVLGKSYKNWSYAKNVKRNGKKDLAYARR